MYRGSHMEKQLWFQQLLPEFLQRGSPTLIERSSRSFIKCPGEKAVPGPERRAGDALLEKGLRLRGAGVGRRWDWKPPSAGKQRRTACAHGNWACCGLPGSLLSPIFSETNVSMFDWVSWGNPKAGKVCVGVTRS